MSRQAFGSVTFTISGIWIRLRVRDPIRISVALDLNWALIFVRSFSKNHRFNRKAHGPKRKPTQAHMPNKKERTRRERGWKREPIFLVSTQLIKNSKLNKHHSILQISIFTIYVFWGHALNWFFYYLIFVVFNILVHNLRKRTNFIFCRSLSSKLNCIVFHLFLKNKKIFLIF